MTRNGRNKGKQNVDTHCVKDIYQQQQQRSQTPQTKEKKNNHDITIRQTFDGNNNCNHHLGSEVIVV